MVRGNGARFLGQEGEVMGEVADCLRFFLKLLNLPIKMLKTLLELKVF